MRVLVMWVWTAEVPSNPGPAPDAAADRLVVLAGRVAEDEVVHRRLTCRPAALHRAEQRVDRSACDVSVLPATTAAPGCGRQEGAGRDHQPIGFRQPSLSGMSSADQTAQRVKHRRAQSPPAAR